MSPRDRWELVLVPVVLIAGVIIGVWLMSRGPR